MKFDLHIHSNHSRNSLIKHETIFKIAKKREPGEITVIDHDIIKGGFEYFESGYFNTIIKI